MTAVPRPWDARAAAETAARQSYGRLLAVLAARSRDVAAAEDALADAFATALEQWPRNGVPDRPEAWLLTVVRRRAIDRQRHLKVGIDAQDHLLLIGEESKAMELKADSEDVPDKRLALMFACAHPAINPEIRAPLILQTVLGFDATTIASAFLVAPATMGQRLVRAKTRIRQTGIPFRLPDRADLPERLDAVLEAIYAAFTEGWSDPAGGDSRRRDLAGEAIWLGRLVASLMPGEPEALGLLALMLYAEARREARRTAGGDYVPLADQDIALWDDAMIDDAEQMLACAMRLAQPGRYQIEAALQSAHCARRQTGRTDWPAIAELYRMLGRLSYSPVVEVNRAVALAESGHAKAGLAILDRLSADRRLADYQPYWAARGIVLTRLDHNDSAREAYRRAIALERDPAVQRFLQGRMDELPTSLLN
ncbi:RNA polymerase sigma factor [Mesorhizobium sp. IMUNJ 23232]|uniref:RNA polymerase sigma factor n=1 Tax=Mesorhizobium sp. IMUNJ 23232 TaxID=3376064 RepID=UPI00378E99BD